MPKSRRWAVRPEAGAPGRGLAIAAILLLTAFRIVTLWFDRTELYTDEAQYWFWGQDLAFGAFSKPPLIGWLIRAMTELFGQTEFAVRLVAPLLHGITALLVLALGLRVASDRVAGFAALSYATLPAVALGSALVSTDTPLLACIAAGLLMQHVLAARALRGQGAPLLAVTLGLVLGLGFLAKYAMVYAMAGMVAAAVVSRDWRIRRADLGIAALVFVATIAPNLWWVAAHGFVTAKHLAADAEWAGPKLDALRGLKFLAEQFAVMGPVLFGAWLLALMTPGRGSGALRGLLAASVVVLGIVVVQAVTSRALANWGVGFVIAGCLVAAARLERAPLLRALSLALGLALSLALPILKVEGTALRLPNGQLVLDRYLGRAEVSQRAIALAQQNGAGVILSADRELLADLSWQVRAGGPEVFAAPFDGAPRHHWDLTRPYPGGTAPVVLLAKGDQPPTCRPGTAPLLVDHWTAGPGFAEGRAFTLSLLPADCLVPAP